MAEPEAAEGRTNVVAVEEEIEGEQICTRDYRFSRIGESVPIKPGSDSEFDTSNLPSRPLAVSDHFGVIFVAHSSGFCVAKTKEVLSLAVELKNGGSGSSIQELSVVDVSIGKVSILALSSDSSTLAVSVGSNLHFFSVAGLLSKEQEPSYSKSLNDSCCIKDMQWNTKVEDCYLVLSTNGKLYYGSGQNDLNNFMVNVDAVDWSVGGKFIAAAKSNYLSILSSRLKEKLQIMLSFKSWVSDSDENCIVKVDSIRWVRLDCIVLGCYQLNTNGTEENYLVQVITAKDGKFGNASSNPIAFSFSDVFLSLNDDTIPLGSGPYMFLNYLEESELAFIANRKNMDQHIVLIGWSSDEKSDAAMIEISNDAWIPTIDLQGNGEDNLILGLAVDKVSRDESLKFMLGERDTEVSPCCILLCLTVDAKLFMFHFASATGPSVRPEVVESVSDDEEGSRPISSECGLLKFSNDDKQIGDQALQPHKVKVNEPNEKVGDETHMRNGNEQVKAAAFSPLSKSGMNQDVPIVNLDNIRDKQPQVTLASTSNNDSPASFSSAASFSSKAFDMKSSPSPYAAVQGSTELSGHLGSNSLHVSSGSLSSGALFPSKTFDVKSSVVPDADVQGSRSDVSASTASFPSGSVQNPSVGSKTSGPLTSSNLIGQVTSTRAGITSSLPSFGQFKVHSDEGNHRTRTPSRLLNSVPNMSEQRSVEEMANELDTLLESIERHGGFYDASVALQESSVTALEDGIWTLSEHCQMWTRKMDQRLGEIQLLLDKTVQVLARKIYTEAVVKQATDSKYWDIWNRQKLSSELEMKRRHILEINQNLTNQLIELERHLNTLELQRFGDDGGVHMNRRSCHSKHVPSRHIQSLHSLHNTMNAQLAAAEKLSECLSKQMTALRIETEPVNKQNVKKELFETIGISYDGTTFSSPGDGTRDMTWRTEALMSSGSTAAKSHPKKRQPSAVKSSEPETARRCRASLDRNWASLETPRTTVKRMLLKEDRQKLDHRMLERSAIVRDIQGSQDTQIKRYSVDQSNTSLWAYRSDSSKTLGNAALSLGSDSRSIRTASPDAARDSRDSTPERSRNRPTFTVKSDAVSVDDLKSSQQSRSFLDQPLSTNSPAQANIFPKKPIEFSGSSDKDVVTAKSTTDGNQRPITTENSSFWMRKSQESSFSTASGACSTTPFSGKSFSLGAATRESHINESMSSISVPSFSVPVTSSASLSTFKETTPTTRPAISEGISSRPGVRLDVTQTASLTGSTVSSSPSSPTTTTVQATSVASSSIKSSVDIELNTSQSELSKLNPKAADSSETQVVSVPKFGSKPDEISSPQTLPSQPTLASGTSSLKLEPSVQSVATSELPESSSPGSQLNSSATNSPTLVISNSKPEQLLVAPLTSSPAFQSSADGVGENNDSSDVAFTQEDEMEEEAPETTQLALGNLGGFGLGSAPNPAAPKQNPFGAPFGNTAAITPVTSFTVTAPSGGLFRPASFNLQSPQPSQPSQQTNFGAFPSGFGSNINQSSTGQGFGQPAQIGSGQQALGSVLGSFGQSRQLGAGLPGSVTSATPFGGFGGNQSAAGFASASSGGGFASLASGGGGFGALATNGVGGFAAAPTPGGGFGGIPAAGGGFAAAATGVGGFAGAASGGFGAFSSQGGSGAFSTFGSTGGTGKPPSELFTQMRK